MELAASYRLKTAQKKAKYGQTWKTWFWALRKSIVNEKIDIIMPARQMNVRYMYIAYVRVTETEAVMYL